MFENYKKYYLSFLVIFILLIDLYVFSLNLKEGDNRLVFAMFDIGQGDALYIKSPTGTEILFDGGPPKKIIGQLQQVMSPFDKNIDAIVITNPDADHISGFLDILKNYKVDKMFEPGTLNDSKTYQNIKNEIRKQNILDILARKGMRLDIGGGAVIDILFPDRDVFDWSTNDGSMVAKLTYGNNSIMLTGDATRKTEKIILREFSKNALKSTILKVGHHGSRTSTSEEFMQAVLPTYALISDGRNNKYGHPHLETLDILNQFGVNILRTDLLGTIIIKCDRILECEINK